MNLAQRQVGMFEKQLLGTPAVGLHVGDRLKFLGVGTRIQGIPLSSTPMCS
jgi:hypothetical protein